MPIDMPLRPSAEPDPFVVLGVSEHSSDEAINAAWRRQMRLFHPDHAVDEADRRRRLAKSIELNKAHDTLLDPTLKAEAILARRSRTWAGPAAPSGRRASAPAGSWAPEAPGRTYEAWAGAKWSSYRAGGHPEARDRWAYTEPEPSAQVDAQPAPQSFQLRNIPAPARIVLMTLVVLLESAWAVLCFIGRQIAYGVAGPTRMDGDEF